MNVPLPPPEQEPDINSPLVWRTFVNDHTIRSYNHWPSRSWSGAGVQFIETNLQGIQIPRADLSYGVFDSAHLQGADLRMVNFRGAWFRQTDMSRAQMAGGGFGATAHLHDIKLGKDLDIARPQHRNGIYSIVYSPTNHENASGGVGGRIRLLEPWTLQFGYGMQEQGSVIVSYRSISPPFIPLRSRRKEIDLVSGGEGVEETRSSLAARTAIVRIWDAVSGTCSQLLEDQANLVRNIIYLSQGNQLASACYDKTVRL
ncbi:MAG: hypothetical protein J3Q66DRAFT_397707 [Benniella sp.]|nr:MAG: hypothetical protein J3Q66DRAFT_397707 [Benniella sp.]